jgi:ABC-type antimicrobial peptide transport system permease subunit
MWISIRERTREIGTLRAIGMQRTRVLAMFVTEGFLLGIAGTAIGIGLGLVASAVLNASNVPLPIGVQLFLMTDHLVLIPTLMWVLVAIVMVTSSITVVSLIPSFFAARMKPITAMHHIG